MNIIDQFIKDQHRNIPELEDDSLIANYYATKSVKKRLETIKAVLCEYGINHTKSAIIAKKLLVIPPGTKSTVRGNKFNEIVCKEIKNILKKLNVELEFDIEKKHCGFHEIPDWIITNGKKTLVGYNQISLFGGGHQLNRASKYVMDDIWHAKLSKKRIKMVCVVKDIPVRSRGKSLNILMKGIEKKRIYCVGGIKKLIKSFFVE